METAKVLNAVSLLGTIVPHLRDPLGAGLKKTITRRNPVFLHPMFLSPFSLLWHGAS